MTRATITTDTAGHVTLTYTDPVGDFGCPRRVRREFYVRGGRDGRAGYVCEAPAGRQVCSALGARGATLMATVETLPAVIRREWASLRRLFRAMA